MAHSSSAKKRIRQTLRNTIVNRGRVGQIRTSVKSVEAAISSGDKAAAEAAFRAAMPVMHSGINKGVMHRNTVARKLSRLSARINTM